MKGALRSPHWWGEGEEEVPEQEFPFRGVGSWEGKGEERVRDGLSKHTENEQVGEANTKLHTMHLEGESS